MLFYRYNGLSFVALSLVPFHYIFDTVKYKRNVKCV